MTSCTTNQIACHPVATLPTRRIASPLSLPRRRRIGALLRRTVLAVWGLLPSLSAPTPSDEAMAALTPGERLGERL